MQFDDTENVTQKTIKTTQQNEDMEEVEVQEILTSTDKGYVP